MSERKWARLDLIRPCPPSRQPKDSASSVGGLTTSAWLHSCLSPILLLPTGAGKYCRNAGGYVMMLHRLSKYLCGN